MRAGADHKKEGPRQRAYLGAETRQSIKEEKLLAGELKLFVLVSDLSVRFRT
jgi:hypothetical protein